jgi:hypothetical protein
MGFFKKSQVICVFSPVSVINFFFLGDKITAKKEEILVLKSI